MELDDIKDYAQAYPALTSAGCTVNSFAKGIAATILAWLEPGTLPPPEQLTGVDLGVRASTV